MKRVLTAPPAARGAMRQRGFTLVEMMVALAIGLVLALGFAVSFVNLKSTFGTQDKLSQLQDNERLALAFLTSSVQEAGYFPDTAPPSRQRSTALVGSSPAGYTGMANGQFLLGSVASADGSTPASLTTVYNSASGDGLLNCQGGTYTGGGVATLRNMFYVDAATNALGCKVFSNGVLVTTAGATGFAPLVTNVSSMDVDYAIDADGDGIADEYVKADQVGTHWNDVKAVRVTLNFINPNAALGGGQAATIAWTQTINLMNNR